MAKEKGSAAKTEPDKLKLYRVLAIGGFVLIAGGALSIPFAYETQTLWYKIGIDKTLLRGGQMAGLLAAVLVFVQILLAARGKFLKELFGLAALMRWHRRNGIVIALLAIGHVTLVMAPEGLTNFPIGKKYWPEMVGGLLLLILVSMAISSHFREKLALNYRRWRAIHKLLGYLVLIIISGHVLFVSESFKHPVPKTAFVTIVVGVVAAVLLSKITSPRPPPSRGK
jgi:predicted ferric reductase